MNLRIKIYKKPMITSKKKPMILNVSKEALCRDIIASFAKINLYNHFSVLLCNFNYIIYIYLHYTHKLRPLLNPLICARASISTKRRHARARQTLVCQVRVRS